MKLVMVSNLLNDHADYNKVPEVFGILQELDTKHTSDSVLIILGNGACSTASANEIIDRLSDLPYKHKLWVAGPEDLKLLPTCNRNYEKELANKLDKSDIHLLDYAPYAIDNTYFVGNLGWFDGTMWSSPTSTSWPSIPKWPKTKDEAATGWKEFYNKHIKDIRTTSTSLQFFAHCQSRLKAHLDSTLRIANPADQIIMCTHHMPSATLLKRERTPEEWYQSYAAGWVPDIDWKDIIQNNKQRMRWYSGWGTHNRQSKINLATHNTTTYSSYNLQEDTNGLPVRNVGARKIVTVDVVPKVAPPKPSVM